MPSIGLVICEIDVEIRKTKYILLMKQLETHGKVLSIPFDPLTGCLVDPCRATCFGSLIKGVTDKL